MTKILSALMQPPSTLHVLHMYNMTVLPLQCYQQVALPTCPPPFIASSVPASHSKHPQLVMHLSLSSVSRCLSWQCSVLTHPPPPVSTLCQHKFAPTACYPAVSRHGKWHTNQFEYVYSNMYNVQIQ